jgi:hypothetical protein
VAAAFFVSYEFGAELEIFSFNYDGFVHFGADNYAVEYASPNWQGAVEGAIFVVAGFFGVLEC